MVSAFLLSCAPDGPRGPRRRRPAGLATLYCSQPIRLGDCGQKV